jgi:hypothetical protein
VLSGSEIKQVITMTQKYRKVFPLLNVQCDSGGVKNDQGTQIYTFSALSPWYR